MHRRLLAATVLALLAVPASAAADCADKKFSFTSTKTLKEAEYGGGGALGQVEASKGDDVTGDSLTGGQTYYAPLGARTTVKIGGYSFKVGGGSYFIAQCDLFDEKNTYFRLLDGRVATSGKRPVANRAYGYVVTPDATFLPRPGNANFTVTREVTSKAKTTYSRVTSARNTSLLFVKISALAKRGKQIPCQGGAEITIYGNGAYENG